MEARLQLRKAGTTIAVDSTNYRSIVGSLRYLVNTRLDLAYSIGYMSRFMEAPREEHLVAVKHILCYVAETRGRGVRYCVGRGNEKLELVDYSDSDMAGHVDDRKSTNGMIYFLSGGAICSQSTKPKIVVLSSCEAKKYSVSDPIIGVKCNNHMQTT